MDPRQAPPSQRDPFSRNAPSPYSRAAFPAAPASQQQQQQQQHHPHHQQQQQQQQQAQQHPYPPPPVSHSAPAGPAYSDLQRRPSDPPYHPQPRSYPPTDTNSHPQPNHTHSRHQSSSSISSGPLINRAMPPPGSPPQGQGPSSHQGPGAPGYGLPAPRPPPVNVGPPTAFPGGRELPALGSLPRTGSTGSSMSISSMLGGPPRDRDPAPPPSHYPPASGPGLPGPGFPPSMHASPRMHQNTAEYGGQFRRPQTPEHAHRIYDGRDPRDPRDARDPRGPPGASPQGAHATPEFQRYGTPQQYAQQRGPPLSAAEQQARDQQIREQQARDQQARDQQVREQQARMSGNPISRPESQPNSFANMAGRPPMEMGRQPPSAEHFVRREEEYNPERPPVRKYEDPRFMQEREMEMRERERMERKMQMREREMRERALSGGDPRDPNRQHAMLQEHYLQQMPPRGPQPPFGRQPDPREPGPWQRQSQQYEPARAPYDPAAPFPRHHEYPTTAGPHYGGHASYGPAPNERYPPTSQPPHHQGPPHLSGPAPPYTFESPERQRMNAQQISREQQQQQQQHQQHQHQPSHLQRSRTLDEASVPPPSVAYTSQGARGMFEPPRNRSLDDSHPLQHQQMSLLQIQEMNRRGRISPLPQAVQGAQPQLSGPAGEPGIKSEFGRLFAGVNSGIGGLSSPAPSRTQLTYPGTGLMRREDTETQDQIEAPAKTGATRGKRRKPKDEEPRDEDSNGRQSPAGRAKRAKIHAHHHHQYVPPHLLSGSTSTGIPNSLSHHHHHHHHAQDQATSPAGAGPAALRSLKGPTSMPSPPGGFSQDLHPAHHYHVVPRSTPNNHAQTGTKPSALQPNAQAVIVPKPKQIIDSRAVLDSVASLPRNHLGDVPYEVKLKPARMTDPRTGRPPRHGYASTPIPLPWELIKGQLNCTVTVKVGRQHLTPSAREEITSRRAVWGTEIYTDDSDIIAACIHSGWIRGEWPEDVDVDLLDLVPSDDKEKKGGRRAAPSKLASVSTNADVLTEPPKTGPMAVPPNRELQVTIVILPLLEKYSSTVRFGIKSREFGGKIGDGHGLPQRSVHDGLSFRITGIRWVSNGAGTQNRLRGKARRERIRRALREVEQAPLMAKALNVDTNVTGDAAPAESVQTPIEGDVELSGSWWRRKAAATQGAGNKENQPQEDEPVADSAAVNALVVAVIDTAPPIENAVAPVVEKAAAVASAIEEVVKEQLVEAVTEVIAEPTEDSSAPKEETVEQPTEVEKEVAEKVAEEVTEELIDKVVEETGA